MENFNMMPPVSDNKAEKREKESFMETLRSKWKALALLGVISAMSSAAEMNFDGQSEGDETEQGAGGNGDDGRLKGLVDMGGDLSKYLENPEPIDFDFEEDGDEIKMTLKKIDAENLARGTEMISDEIANEMRKQGMSEEQIAATLEAPTQEEGKILPETQVVSR